ncbi:helix-hairpin-helix domain-containing protein [Massilia sp. TS11]|uniref:ComEA family DNA-binding protein n=1 Tax=Massilia sp. TS11 TaxID=2908003 RepID=UPI001EDA009D|nr:helix-hairpin-helix domain-containing protein [Massilia sp. TS11]MCG2583561.1 helix-hairpin-helix domain-containing protein [Massilia sp. TS11]
MRSLLLAASMLIGAEAAAAELAVLTPVIQDKQALMRPGPQGGAPAPVLTRVHSGALHSALQKEARQGFTASMLQLDEAAMRLAGKGQRTWLMLAQEDGGFARSGFWLREGAHERFVDEPFVDLVVDADSVADGSFEEIFAHELGHVLLRRLLPALPNGFARAAHHSYSLTDQQTAFDEGFATHFQALARRFTRNARLQAQDQGIEFKAFTPLWESNFDRAMRIEGVRQNLFVHHQIGSEPTAFDRARLRNGAQLLASEGFLATVFYRQQAPGSQQALAARYTPLFRAFMDLNRQPLTPDSALLPLLAQSLNKVAPAAGQAFIKQIVETSYGVLGAPALASKTEALALAGRKGDGEAFVPALQALRKEMAAAVAAVQAAPARLAEHTGPALWLLAGEQCWDLNTADAAQLAALPGIGAEAAARAVASRDRDGLFKDLADATQRSGIAPAALNALAAAARAAGPLTRQ